MLTVWGDGAIEDDDDDPDPLTEIAVEEIVIFLLGLGDPSSIALRLSDLAARHGREGRAQAAANAAAISAAFQRRRASSTQ